MRRFVIFFLAVCSIGGVLAQDETHIISRQGSVSIMPMYQQWSLKDQFDFSEFNTSLSLYLPAGKEWSVSLRGLPASVVGDVTHLSGYTDTQVGVSYHGEEPDIVYTLGVNLPTGKKELTQQEFETSILLSNSVFGLQVPNFGQGLNITPGIVYAVPLNEEVVLGFGASYQYKGSYRTLANYDDYDPGDEVVLTGGVDLRLEEATTLSTDIVVTTYGTDKLGADEVLAPSTKVAANALFNKGLGADELSFFAQFVLKGSSKFAVGNLMVDEVDRIEPNRFDLRGRYTARLGDQLQAGFFIDLRLYQSTEVSFAGKNVIGLGLEPVFAISNSLSLPCSVKYQTGELADGTTLSSILGGIGVRIKF
ncbi:MAG TPA: hypothetical protein VGR15_10630 [Bacteroidota bacterium]|nr:hypothetical protein [Bacteroidota bacterium]